MIQLIIVLDKKIKLFFFAIFTAKEGRLEVTFR